jgi:hypothetical protein
MVFAAGQVPVFARALDVSKQTGFPDPVQAGIRLERGTVFVNVALLC